MESLRTDRSSSFLYRQSAELKFENSRTAFWRGFNLHFEIFNSQVAFPLFASSLRRYPITTPMLIKM